MPSLLKRSLEARVITVLGLVLLGLLTISSAIDLHFETKDSYHIVFKELDVLANTVQKSLIKDMRDGRGGDVQEILEMVGTEKGIIAVRIFDEKGKILRSSERSEIGKAMPAATVESYRAGKGDFVSDDGVKILHLIHPIANAPQCYGCHGKDIEVNGVLALDYSLDPLVSYLYYHKVRMVLLLLLTIATAGGAIYWLLVKLVTGPIKGLQAAMADAETGNLDIMIPVSSEDEIGSLQQSFNNMLARILELNERTLAQQRDLVRKEQDLKMQSFLEGQNRVLEEANKEIVLKNRYYLEMLSFISHELKNPLMVLKGYSGLFIKGDLGELNGQQHEAIKAMERNVEVLQEMIANYLGLSRIERGDLKPEWKSIDLVEDVVRPVMQDYTEMVEKESMGMRVECPNGAVRLVADPGLIKSVLGNLISNAVKYGRENTDVVVEVEPEDAVVRVSVVNEGSGIPFEELGRVFERFTRLDNDDARSKKGSGLGLYIVKNIVEMHGGKVWAESREGAWAKVTFTIPVQPAGI